MTTVIKQDRDWILSYKNYNPKEEGQRESLTALGNGYFASRGAQFLSEQEGINYPGTYVAGLYNRAITERKNQKEENEDLVKLPNWLPLSIALDNENWIDVNEAELESYSLKLNLKEGVLYREFELIIDKVHRFKVSEKRLVHMRHFHLAAQEIKIKALNWSGSLAIKVALDGQVENKGAYGYRHLNGKHISPQETNVEDNTIHLKTITSQSKVVVAQSTRTTVRVNGEKRVHKPKDSYQAKGYVSQTFNLELLEGHEVIIEKVCSLYTSRDWATSEPGEQAKNAVIDAPSFEILLDDQIEEWNHLWSRFDLELDSNGNTQGIPAALILRLHSFHVLQTASPNSIDLDCGIPARGWTGEAYRGHVFWDDLFVFPFLNLRMPEITQSLLRYRYRRLNEARKLAQSLGSNGARFPWESASSGSEETPKHHWSVEKDSWVPVRTNLQIHVNAAIAYNIWQYYQVTGDLHLIYAYGAELLFEIARFFASFAKYNSEIDRFEILGIAGPDEFHQAYPGSSKQGINNNAYTNVMAAWTITRALELYDNLPEDHRIQITEKLNLTDAEIENWDKVSRRLYVPWHKDGIINQFDGYEDLKEFPHKSNGYIDEEKVKEILEEQGGHLNQYKVSKQADVLMLFYVFSAEELEAIFGRLGYEFPLNTIPSTISYYMKHTVDHSTLSRVTHAWVLSRLDRPHSWHIISKIFPGKNETKALPSNSKNNVPESWGVFIEALASDYHDIQGGTTSEGIHMGAMAGTIDIIQRGYTGIVTRDDVLWFNPYLPKDLNRLAFNIHYRSQSLRFTITHSTVTVKALHSSAKPVQIGFLEDTYSIQSGEELTFSIKEGTIISAPKAK